ncbi:MAG: hypothetical protein GY794_25960 [bacterium]|nr:hypothetical protein [bacterium]
MRNKADLSSAAAAQLVKERFHLVVHPRSIERAIERRKKNDEAFHELRSTPTAGQEATDFVVRAAA